MFNYSFACLTSQTSVIEAQCSLSLGRPPSITIYNMFTMFKSKIWILFPAPYHICIIYFFTSTTVPILMKMLNLNIIS